MKKITLLGLAITFTMALAAQPKGLDVNTKAPDFTATNQNGQSVKLSDQLKNGPVVLMFYRGYWCPFCNKQLMALQDSLAQITGKGATLLAVTPEKPENIAKTTMKTKASFSVLHDAGLNIMKNYDVSFTLDSATQKKYRGYGIDLDANNGANGQNLPVPAVYIISKEGVITWRFFDVNYAKRPSVKDILAQLP
jgi:peroxiredoxin